MAVLLEGNGDDGNRYECRGCLVSFEPDKVSVHIDGTRLRLEPGQNVIPHGVGRHLDVDESPAEGR